MDFDREGQFVPFESAPDRYQLWSTTTPEITVVVLPVCGRLTIRDLGGA